MAHFKSSNSPGNKFFNIQVGIHEETILTDRLKIGHVVESVEVQVVKSHHTGGHPPHPPTQPAVIHP